MKTNQHQPKYAIVLASEATLLMNSRFATFARPEPRVPAEPDEHCIRDCAYTLYEEGNRCDGHDIDHWVEATAQLKARALGSWETSDAR